MVIFPTWPVIPWFESLEALEAEKARKADEEQIAARIEEFGIGADGARDMIYGDLKYHSQDEITQAQDKEAEEKAWEQDFDFSAFWYFETDTLEEGNSKEPIAQKTYAENNPEPPLTAEEWEKTLVWSAGKDILDPNIEQKERKTTPSDDAPFTPIIKSLLPEGDYRQAVIEALQNSTPDNPNLKILDEIDGLPTEEKSKLTKKINSLLSQDENELEQRKQELERDFWLYINEFKTGPSSKKGQFNNESDLAAFERLAHQYFPENTDNPEEKRRALDTAFKTALNFEINGKSLDKNQESYKKAVATIRDDTASFHDRFTALKSIIIYIGVDQGKWWAKQEREYRQKVAEAQLREYGLYERFMKLLLQYRTAPEHSKLEISQELEQIRDNCWVTPWDAALLAGWVLDRLREHTRTAKEIA